MSAARSAALTFPSPLTSPASSSAAGASGALLAAVFQAIRASREHAGETFNARRFAVGIASAGGVGAVTAWILRGFNVNHHLEAAVVSMMGYVGGPLLDMLYCEAQETIQAGFDGLQKWLSEGRWKSNDK